jgi:RHS repeat-associated protein
MVSRIFLKGLELEGEASGTEEPAWYHFGDGKVRIFSGQGPVPDDPFVADYYLKDHLGNIMVVFRDDNGDCVITTEEDPENREVIERYMYYALGMQCLPPDYFDFNGWQVKYGVWRPENNPPDDAPNRYRYNGKEWHFSTGMLDYGFRYYMPEIGRFSGVDPCLCGRQALAENGPIYMYNNT